MKFANNDYDNTAKIPIFSGWNGYELEVDVNNLLDERNWNNGTFNFGNDDGNSAVTDDDNELTADNSYQNWTFYSYDNTFNFTNPMSGNYRDNIDGHDCLELRMNGEAVGGTFWYGYDNGDNAWWSTSIHIPRGQVIDGKLEFETRAFQILNINSWRLIFHLNNQEIYSIGVYDLERYCDTFPNDWGRIEVPMDVWTNTSNIFSGIVDNADVILNISLEYTVGTTMYGGFADRQYQQIFVDNINLTLNAEAKPTQLDLKMNQTDVIDIDWGEGRVKIQNGNWNGTLYPWVHANFSSIGYGDFGNYFIELEADLNLFALKNQPDTNYEKNAGSIGTNYFTGNNSLVNWESYALVNEPSGYLEFELLVEFPKDVSIRFVSEAAQPSINISDLCDLTSRGVLKIPVNILSNNPDGYWKFEATSPNYCDQITTYNDVTGSWQQNSTFFSGDNINITAKIKTSNPFVDISGYIENTKAELSIRFPNGNLWTAESQFKSPDINGYVYFEAIPIPSNPPDYQAGVYQAIVTWNNSHSIYGMNETGIIYTNFTVIHDSILKPDDDKYYIEGIIDDESIILKLSFNDKEDSTAISNAIVYAKYPTGDIFYFFEPSIGSYWFEYDASTAEAGNNTLMIFGNSTFYSNKIINITIEVTKQTLVKVDSDFFSDIPYEQNFTIQFNYTEKNTGNGIDVTPSTDWSGVYNFKQSLQGVYNLICNTSAYSANKLVVFYIFLDKKNYEAQTIQIRVQITELASSLELLINDNQVHENEKVTFDIFEPINITVKYRDSLDNHLSGATVNLVGKGTLDEIGAQYNITLNSTTDLNRGNNILVVFANITDYNFQEVEFIVEITKKNTKLQIFLNSVNSTFDPFINLPIGATLNITAKYIDNNDAYISNALIELGVGLKENLTENFILNQYSTSINTNQLGLGDNVISIIAQKTDYKVQSDNLIIQVRKIRTKIETEDGEDTINIRPGESISIKIEIENLDFGGKVKEAEVTYEWEYGEGDLEEIEDGVYELVLENVPEGGYTIEISVYKEGGKYEFDDLKITLTASRPEGESLLFLILLLIAISVAVALASYIIYYHKVLKYPKPVRKVRKYRKTLNKKNDPRVDIISRKKAFNNVFASELDKTGELIKGKTSEEIASTAKIVKKSLKLSTGTIIKGSEESLAPIGTGILPVKKGKKKKKIVIFEPHPIDLLMGMGPIIFDWIEEKHDIHVITVTDGRALIEKVKKVETKMSGDDIADMRINEAKKAFMFLKIPPENLHILNIRDKEVKKYVKAGIERIKPLIKNANQIVLPSNNNMDEDHQATYEIVVKAAKNLKLEKISYWIYTVSKDREFNEDSNKKVIDVKLTKNRRDHLLEWLEIYQSQKLVKTTWQKYSNFLKSYKIAKYGVYKFEDIGKYDNF